MHFRAIKYLYLPLSQVVHLAVDGIVSLSNFSCMWRIHFSFGTPVTSDRKICRLFHCPPPTEFEGDIEIALSVHDFVRLFVSHSFEVSAYFQASCFKEIKLKLGGYIHYESPKAWSTFDQALLTSRHLLSSDLCLRICSQIVDQIELKFGGFEGQPYSSNFLRISAISLKYAGRMHNAMKQISIKWPCFAKFCTFHGTCKFSMIGMVWGTAALTL